MSGRHEANYQYSKEGESRPHCLNLNRAAAERLSKDRAFPSISHPDYLVLRARVRNFKRLLERITGMVSVLDVGGRIQPYRLFLKDRLKSYFAIDPQYHGLIDAVAVGEQLPFPDCCFELILCTQVLSYAKDPFRLVAEIYRVLLPGGYLFLTAPAFFPRHDDERWRFLPDGLKLLLARFAAVEILPEGNSIAGGLRTLNVLFNVEDRHWLIARALRATVIPVFNSAGLLLDRLCSTDQRLTANYSVLARK